MPKQMAYAVKLQALTTKNAGHLSTKVQVYFLCSLCICLAKDVTIIEINEYNNT